jgi:hypothetical protein
MIFCTASRYVAIVHVRFQSYYVQQKGLVQTEGLVHRARRSHYGLNGRSSIGALAQLLVLPNVIALAALPTMTSPWARHAVVTVLLSFPSTHAMQVRWCSRDSNTVRTRTVSASLYNIFVQVGGIVISNIYRQNDAPLYRQGNKALVAFCVMNVVVYGLVKVYYVWRNRVRTREWDGMSREAKQAYLENTTDTGSGRKDFKLAH